VFATRENSFINLNSWNSLKGSKRGLVFDDFKELMINNFASVCNPTVIGELYEEMDSNHDGILDFNEFSFGIARLSSGTIEEKIQFMFRSHGCFKTKNSKPDEELQHEELQLENDEPANLCLHQYDIMEIENLISLVVQSNSEMSDCARFVDVVLTMMDYDRNGEVDRGEFLRGVREVPQILTSFDECLRPSEEFKTAVRTLVKRFPVFNPLNIAKTWKLLGKERETFKFVSWPQFLEFVDPIWSGSGCSPKGTWKSLSQAGFDEYTPSSPKNSQKNRRNQRNFIVQNIQQTDDEIYTCLFDIFQRGMDPESEEIDLRKMIIGIVVTMADKFPMFGGSTSLTNEEKATLYFELFDVDCNESVEYQEFFELMYSSQLNVQDSGWKTIEVLRHKEAAIGPTISLSDFMQLLVDHQASRDYYSRILCANAIQGNTEPSPRMEEVEGLTPLQIDSVPNLLIQESKIEEPKLDPLSFQSIASISKLFPSSSMPVLPLKSIYRTSYEFKGKESPQLPKSKNTRTNDNLASLSVVI